MGLYISFYSNIKEVGTEDLSDFNTLHQHDTFMYHLGTLLPDKYYKITEFSDVGRFRAGSYSGYNNWRKQLAIMVGYISDEYVWMDFEKQIRSIKLKSIENKKIKMKPFYELIYFSDAEGVIGPDISKKLYSDFVEFDDKAKEFGSNIYYFYSSYVDWKEAFRVASNNGAVYFH